MTKEEARKLARAKLIAKHPELASSFALEDLKSSLESSNKKQDDAKVEELRMQVMIEKMKSKGEKGDPGYTPLHGVDYFTEEDINKIKDGVKEEITPVKGVDYFDGVNGDSIKGEKGDQGEPGETIKGEKGDAGKDGSPDSPERIAEKLNMLSGVLDYKVLASVPSQSVKDIIAEMKKLPLEQRLDISDIRNWNQPAKGKLDQRWHGGGLTKVYHDTTLTGDGTLNNPLSAAAEINSPGGPQYAIQTNDPLGTFAGSSNFIFDGSRIGTTNGSLSNSGSNGLELAGGDTVGSGSYVQSYGGRLYLNVLGNDTSVGDISNGGDLRIANTIKDDAGNGGNWNITNVGTAYLTKLGVGTSATVPLDVYGEAHFAGGLTSFDGGLITTDGLGKIGSLGFSNWYIDASGNSSAQTVTSVGVFTSDHGTIYSNASGTLTAVAFIGDGSGLTNLPSGPWTLDVNNNLYSTGNGASLTSGTANFFAGASAGISTADGGDNIFIGTSSGSSNVSGNYNIFLGSNAGTASVSGVNNNFIGKNAGIGNIDGNNNNFFGVGAGQAHTSGDDNVFIGIGAGFGDVTGTENIIIGSNAGYSNAGSNYNVYLGFYAGYANVGNGNVFIGQSAGAYRTASSNTFIVNNFNTGSEANDESKSLLFGVFDTTTANQVLEINANTTIRGNLGNYPLNGGLITTYTASNDTALQILNNTTHGAILSLVGGGTGAQQWLIESIGQNKNQGGTTANLQFYNVTNGNQNLTITPTGKIGLINVTSPTSYLHLGTGAAAAGDSPMKFSLSGAALLTTPEIGAFEGLTDKLYFTITTGTARKELTLNDTALTSGKIPVATTNGRLTDSTAALLVAGGIANVVASSDLTNQSAAITATTVHAVTATGFYRVSWSATITTAASTSSVLGGAAGFQTKFTSPTDSVVKTENPTNITSSAGNTTATTISGTEEVYAKTGTNLQYLFGYTSVGVTAMVYELHITVEYVR